MMVQPFLELKPAAPQHQPLPPLVLLLRNLVVALAYAVTGYAGLQVAVVGDAVTLFWPPSGIAFAALWLGGLRLLPGVVTGAFVVNVIKLRSPELAALVATGNMLPPLVGTLVLRDIIARRAAEAAGGAGELRRVLAFIVVAVLGATMLSATVGTLAVAVIGSVDSSIQSTWLVWWMGDAMGVLIVAPPLLLWRRIISATLDWRGLFDAMAFALAGFGIIAGLLLIDNPIWAVELCKLFTLLLSLWAGTRFGLTGPALMTLLMAAGAVTVTVLGVGPFVRGSSFDSFALLHSYLFAEAVAGMLLAAALADLRRIAASEALARQAADAASANRIRLLTMISHDVRTPLAGIMGVLQGLDRSGLPPETARLTRLGLRAGTTLTTLITDILDVARADAGRILLEPAPFSPAQSLADIVSLHLEPAAARGLALTLSGEAALPPLVRGDRARFEQIIGNLVTNAIAYTPTGQINVLAHWLPEALLPLHITVEDSGPGIDPAQAAQMFEAFGLAPRPGKRSAGLGLGLHICRRLAELMGGSISYAPRPGGGSRFLLALPFMPVTEVAAAMAPPEAEPSLSILLVEDDAISREVTAALLATCGHRVVVAADEEGAVARAIAQSFDLVLMDLQLPKNALPGAAQGCGIVAAGRIRAQARQVLPRIVALSADGSEAQRERCRAAGLDGLLLKPMDLAAGLEAALTPALFSAPR